MVDLVTSCQEYFLDSFCELLKHEQKAFFKVAQSCTTQGGTADSPAFFLAKVAKGCSVGMQAAVVVWSPKMGVACGIEAPQ